MFSSKDLFFTPAAGGYTVSKSLRFRSSATAYLSRTFGTPTDNKKFYLSCCLKRGSLGSAQTIISSYAGDANNFASIYFDAADKLIMSSASGGTTGANATTSAVFRDPSAWYLLEFLFDSTLGTAADRTQIWVNGVRQTVTGTNVPSSAIWHGNTAVINNIGRAPSAANYGDFYLAETNGVDGQSLTLPLCGAYDTNGIWQPAAYTGSYGNNGFYLKFTDVGATTAGGANTGYGKDFAGTNNWTTNNFGTTSTATTYDSMLDSPTNATGDIGNYAVVNPIAHPTTFIAPTDGNLSQNCNTSAWTLCVATLQIPNGSGLWQWELVQTGTANGANAFGVALSTVQANVTGDPGSRAGCSGVNNSSGAFINGATSGSITYPTVGNTVTCLYDATNLTFQVFSNGTSQGTITGLPAGDVQPFVAASSSNGSPTFVLNFGQRPFAYDKGGKALNTQNLSTPTISNGAQYMAAVLYTGTGSSQTITTSSTNSGNNPNGTTFQPDFVWVKGRSGATDHALYDAVRGVQLQLESNTTTAETTETTGLTAFTSSGFTTGALAQMNTNTATYVAWEWNAGGSNATNTTGTIQSTVRANTSAGFSVVTYTGIGGGVAKTFGHGLGAIPGLVIIKPRTTAAAFNDWVVWHSSFTGSEYIYLDLTNAKASSVNYWGNTTPSSTVVTVGGSAANVSNETGITYVAYCFAPVAGYSAFGSYTGNASTDGPFVYTGFRPRWLLLKNTADGTTSWAIYDTSRTTYNIGDQRLCPDLANAESTVALAAMDILSNGFKIRTSGGLNGSTQTIIYAAFAENPFKISRAR